MGHLEIQDHLVLMTGTNDISRDEEGKVKLNMQTEARRAIISHARHTQVLMCQAPMRYDKPELNTYVKVYNQQLEEMSLKIAAEEGVLEKIKIVRINHLLRREHSTEHGLHLNKIKGKRIVAEEIKKTIKNDNF